MTCRALILACGLLLWSAPSAHAMKSEDAHAFTQSIGEQSLLLMKSTTLTQPERRDRFEALLQQTLDFPTIVRAIVGPYWRKMTPEQRERYTESASEWVLLSLSDVLSSVRAESFAVQGVSPIGKDFLVHTAVQSDPQSDPIPMNWRVRCNDEGEERVIDMVIRGLSMVSAQRRQATEVLTDLGIPAFLERLDENRAKTRKAIAKQKQKKKKKKSKKKEL